VERAARKSVAREGAVAVVRLAGNLFVVASVAEVVAGVVKDDWRNGRPAADVVVAEYAMLARKKPKHR